MLREQDRRLSEMIEAQEDRLTAAIRSIENAVTKAESATDRRLEAMNEFRAQMSDQARLFIPRAECEAALGQVARRADEGVADAKAATETLRAALERSQFVSREFIDRYAKEQTEIHDRLFSQLAALFASDQDKASARTVQEVREELSNMRGRTAAYTVAFGILVTIVTVALRFVG